MIPKILVSVSVSHISATINLEIGKYSKATNQWTMQTLLLNNDVTH